MSPVYGKGEFMCWGNENSEFMFSDNETSEFKRQRTALVEQLKQHGHYSSWAEISDRNHFDIILDLAQPDTWLCQQVFKQML